MQASLLLIARRLTTLHDPRWFRAWAYRIVTREAVRAAKRRGRERLLIDDNIPVEALDVQAPATTNFLANCGEAMERLPPATGVVARLHYREGLTLVEIAEALELPLGTVKSRLAYALVRLREAVAGSRPLRARAQLPECRSPRSSPLPSSLSRRAFIFIGRSGDGGDSESRCRNGRTARR